MVSLRRLRAVLLLAVVSALAWGLIGALVAIGGGLIGGRLPSAQTLYMPFLIFGFFGLLAGAIYAVALAMLPHRDGSTGVSAIRAGLMGIIGGLAVFLGLQVALIEGISRASLQMWAVFGLVGGATGLAIQRVAQRGGLPPSADAPEALEP